MQNGAVDHTDQTLEEILTKAHDFPPTVAGDLASPFAVSLADYATLALPNDKVNFLDIQNQRDVLAEHARKRFEFLQLLNTISYIRQHPDDFEGVGASKEADLATEFAAVTAAINKMESEASDCLEDAKKCSFTPFDVSDFSLPEPKPLGAATSGFISLWQNVSPLDPAGLGRPERLLIQMIAGSEQVNVTGFFDHAANAPDRVASAGEMDAQGQVLNVTLSLDDTAFRFEHVLQCRLQAGGLQVTETVTRTNMIVSETPFTTVRAFMFSKTA